MSRQNKLPFQTFTVLDWKDYLTKEEDGTNSKFFDCLGKLIIMVIENHMRMERLEKRVKELELYQYTSRDGV